MNNRLGSSIKLENPVYIESHGSIVGKKEGEGPLGLLFDKVLKDDMNGCATWEEAESSLQKEALDIALKKINCKTDDLSFIFAGDLLGQSIASSFGMEASNRPMFGLYGACSTCGESLTIGAMTVAAGYADRVGCVTSSHFASAEKEFRFPLSYGNQRPLSASWTVTGSGAFILNSKPPKDPICQSQGAVITGMTPGRIVDFGVKDSMNMGACMAPAAADTLIRHFNDYSSQPTDYDKIITGDLGIVGGELLIQLLTEKGFDISSQYMDCGIEIFDPDTQDTHSGGSGCGCSAVTLAAYILRQIQMGNWNKILFVPTGALLSKTSYNEGNAVPGIAHALVLEKKNCYNY